ncbi:MAG: YceI family protein [Flavicella sp.]
MQLFSQEKYFTRTGNIQFEASVPTFEEIKAKNDKVTAIINTKTGAIATLALVKGFRFKIALMEEHFNENYIESDSYPKAKFTGEIIGFKRDNSNAAKQHVVKGTLTLHGISKPLEIKADISQSDEKIVLKASFKVRAADFDIKIPSIVAKKIAETIDIDLDFELKPKK